MSKKAQSFIVFSEPKLSFRYNQSVMSPQDGLGLFGPYGSDTPEHPLKISYALIGTEEGKKKFKEFGDAIRSPIINDSEKVNLKIWPNFPGFEAVFNCQFPRDASLEFGLKQIDLDKGAILNDPYKRASTLVQLYLEHFKVISKSDKNISVIICVVPDIIFQNCRPESSIKDGIGEKLTSKDLHNRISGQMSLLESYEFDDYQFSVDFRRQLKARAMEYNIPIQIIRESTLRTFDTQERSERGLTALSDRAWNFSTTLFYKGGGQPWKLHDAREGVCYVGLVFRKVDNSPNSSSACCAAQMFLDSGDGLVFRGQDGRWYSPKEKTFHLNRKAAHDLLHGLIQTYIQLGGKSLKEIFIHCHSSIDEEEFSGFKDACPEGVKLIGVRVRIERNGVRMYREGKLPVLRGSCWLLNSKTSYLWGSGYKQKIESYDGWETPAPLRIDIQHGKADIEQVSRDIFALTKLNYNSAKMGESEPVTIGFSDKVGEILVSNPNVKNPSPKFKMYI